MVTLVSYGDSSFVGVNYLAEEMMQNKEEQFCKCELKLKKKRFAIINGLKMPFMAN
jgi:hypothetical protein